MTRDEVLLMVAGKDLDDLIATKVMGFHPTDGGWWHGDNGHCERRFDGGGCVDCNADAPAWSPSTSIDDAWTVVGALSARGFALVLEDWQDVKSWAALFHDRQGHDTGHAVAATAPLAICRCALLALLAALEGDPPARQTETP